MLDKVPVTIRIHPLKLDGMFMVADTSILIAQADVYEGQSGVVGVYVPSYETKIRGLFENPLAQIGAPGQFLKPWSREALQQIVDSELPGLAFGSQVVRNAR